LGHALASRDHLAGAARSCAVRDMIAKLSARHALTREVVDNMAARTGGVPLFVEETEMAVYWAIRSVE